MQLFFRIPHLGGQLCFDGKLSHSDITTRGYLCKACQQNTMTLCKVWAPPNNFQRKPVRLPCAAAANVNFIEHSAANTVLLWSLKARSMRPYSHLYHYNISKKHTRISRTGRASMAYSRVCLNQDGCNRDLSGSALPDKGGVSYQLLHA